MNLSSAERSQLSQAVRAESDGELDSIMATYRNAAEEEYLRMILGQKVFTRGADIREYRLLLLMKHVFKRIPSDAQVSALFQTTTAGSRALIRAVMSKYQYEIEGLLESSLQTILSGATQMKDGRMELSVDSENLIEALNRMLEAGDQPVTKKAGTVRRYDMPVETYNQLVTKLSK